MDRNSKLALYIGVGFGTGLLIGYLFRKRGSICKKSNLIDLIQDGDVNKNREKIVQLLNNNLKAYPPIINRNFVQVNRAKNVNNRIRVMQWNVLAKSLCLKDDTSHSFTDSTPKEVFEWYKFRKWRIIEEALRYDCDIICLEEMDAYEQFKNYFHSIGYTSVFCPKYSSTCLQMKDNIGPDGCLILYKIDKFIINNLRCENFYVNDRNEDQVFVLLQLKHRSTNKVLTVVCVHLKSKEKEHERRKNQITYLLKMLKRHLENVNDLKNHPIIFCGDFNGEPFEEFYKLVSNDKEIQFKDTYETCVDSNRKLLPSTFKIRVNSGVISRRIDYIFYTPSTIQLLNYLRLLDLTEIDQNVGFPNLSYSSDHLSLVADLELI